MGSTKLSTPFDIITLSTQRLRLAYRPSAWGTEYNDKRRGRYDPCVSISQDRTLQFISTR